MVLGKKNFLVLGFTNRTGYHTAKFLAKSGANVFISDKVRDDEKETLLKDLINSYNGQIFDLLGTENVNLDNIEIIITSPGVPLTNPIIQEAVKRKIEVIGDIELFYRLRPDITYIAITGTDGKTTTTNLTYKVLNSYLPNTFIGGNVGIPIFSLYEKNIKNLVLEVSSFQIDTTTIFKPRIGVITNIAKDHLDRYNSFEDYIKSKFALFKNSTSQDIVILNKSLISLYDVSKIVGEKIFFSAYRGKENFSDEEVYLDGCWVCMNGERIIDTNKVKLLGKHNIENIMVAVAVGMKMGVPRELIQEVIYSFEPLPHRMEFVAEIDGVRYINDSKATTINAMVSAIKSLDNPIILIVGGLDKGMDFSEAIETIKSKVKYVIAIGNTKEMIFSSLIGNGFDKCYKASSLEEAIIKAKEVSSSGDIVLFSPAYASFDMFKNYEHRGECFKNIVLSMDKK